MKIDKRNVQYKKRFRKKDLKNISQNVEPFKQFDDLYRRNNIFSRSTNNHQ